MNNLSANNLQTHYDALKIIFSYCPLNTLLNANRTCTSWHKIIQEQIKKTLLRNNPHITEATFDLFKQKREIRQLVLKNLTSPNLLKYKITTLEFTSKLSAGASVMLAPPFLVELNKLYIVTLQKIEIIDLKTNQKETKVTTLKDICFPAQLALEDTPSDLALNFKRQNSTTYSCEIEGHSFIFDPQKAGLTFMCEERILHHTPNLAILYRNKEQIEIVEIETKDVIFSLKFPDLDKTRFYQDVLIITNKAGEIQGINVKEGAVLFTRDESPVSVLEMIVENHFVIQIENKNQIEICSSNTGQPLFILPLSLIPPNPDFFQLNYNQIFSSLKEERTGFAPFGSGKFVAYSIDYECYKTELCYNLHIVNAITGEIEKAIIVASEDFSVKIIYNRLIIHTGTGNVAILDIYDLNTYDRLASHTFDRGSHFRLKFDSQTFSPFGFGIFPNNGYGFGFIPYTQKDFILDLASGQKHMIFQQDKLLEYDNTQFLGENEYFIELNHTRGEKLFKSSQWNAKIKIYHLSESIIPSKGNNTSSEI